MSTATTNASIHIKWFHNPSEIASLPTIDFSLTAVEGLRSGQQITLDLYGSEAGQKLGLFESFQIELVKLGAGWDFRNLKDLRPAGDPARRGTHLYCDRFRLTFKGITGSLECILPADEDGFGGFVDVELRAQIGNRMLTVHSAKLSIPRRNPAHLLVAAQDLHQSIEALLHPAPTAMDQIQPIQAKRKDLSMMIEAQKVESLGKAIEDYFQNPDTYYKVHVVKFRRFNELSKKILKAKEDLWKLRYGLETSPILRDLHVAQEEQRQILEEMNQYLDLERGIPDSYRKAAQRGAARRKEISQIDELLKDPFIQILCCLPLGGLIEGGLLIAKGEVTKGMTVAGLNVLTYGGFKALQSARTTYKLFERASEADKSILRPLVESRFAAFFTSSSEWTLASWRVAGKLVEQNISQQLGGFISAIPYVMDLGRFKIDDFSLLFKNKEMLTDCLKAAKNQDYRVWLTQTKNANDVLLALTGLRALAVLKLGYPEYEKMINQSPPSCGQTVKKAVIEGVKIMGAMLENNPEEKAWIEADIMAALKDLPEERFARQRLGLFQDWEPQERAYLAELNRLKDIPRQPQVGSSPSKNAMEKQLGDLKAMWETRSANIRSICGTTSEPLHNQCAEKLVASALVDTTLDEQMEKFVSQLLGARDAATLNQPLQILEAQGKAATSPPSNLFELWVHWTLKPPFRVIDIDWGKFEQKALEIIQDHFQD